MAAIPLPEVRLAVETAFKIPGLYRRGEAAFLYRLARRKGRMVEIGCWMGRTTAILVQASRIWRADVTTVDPFTPMPPPHTQSSPERWARNLRGVGLDPPALMEVSSREAARKFKDAVALVFIDGDHGRGAVAADLADWAPKVQPAGVIALHDMFYPTHPGVPEAVTEWWAANRGDWEFAGQVDYTIAFKRAA